MAKEWETPVVSVRPIALKLRETPPVQQPDDYRPCHVEGCERTCSEEPHMHEGRPICPRCALLRARGRCEWCGDRIETHYLSYASADGRSYCITCWESEGYGYPMPPKARNDA